MEDQARVAGEGGLDGHLLDCTLTLVRAAHCGGSAPTCMGSKPCLLTQTGTSTQAPCGRLVIRPVLGTLPLNLKGSPPCRALMI